MKSRLGNGWDIPLGAVAVPPFLGTAAANTEHWLQQEPQESQCSKIAQAGEDSRSYFLPGQFAFSRALRAK